MTVDAVYAVIWLRGGGVGWYKSGETKPALLTPVARCRLAAGAKPDYAGLSTTRRESMYSHAGVPFNRWQLNGYN